MDAGLLGDGVENSPPFSASRVALVAGGVDFVDFVRFGQRRSLTGPSSAHVPSLPG